MRTVKELKLELDKFPEDAVCYAYEGESVGIAVLRGDEHGFIPLNERAGREAGTIPLHKLGNGK